MSESAVVVRSIVALGLRLVMTDSSVDSGRAITRVFGQFPVRIGRATLNDIRIDRPFVSAFHTVIDLHDDKLVVRDLGSRNGTEVGGRVLAADEVVDLDTVGGVFKIMTLTFVAKAEHLDPHAIPEMRLPPMLIGSRARGAVRETVAAHEAVLTETVATNGADAERQLTRPGQKPSFVDSPEVQAPLAAYRAAAAPVLAALRVHASRLETARREAFLDEVRARLPDVAGAPAFRSTLTGGPAALDDEEARDQIAARVALEGLRAIAKPYAQGKAPPATEEDVIRLVTKLKATLDVVFRSVPSLQAGIAQFASELAVRKPGEAAAKRTPKEVGSALLDYGNDLGSEHRALEGSFADLMIHQLAMVNGVMRGVRSLVADLSPKAVEGELEDMKKKGKAGFTFGPYRFRALWNAYQRRHGDVDDGDKQAFGRVFGSQFVEAYQQYTGDGAQPPREK